MTLPSSEYIRRNMQHPLHAPRLFGGDAIFAT
jgi:hypothetical protein